MKKKNTNYLSANSKRKDNCLKVLHPRIYIEVFFAKQNYIGFCICEILGERYRNQLTHFYFYPIGDICWLVFLELKEKKYISSIEVSKIIIVLYNIIKDLKSLQKKFFFKNFSSNFEYKKNILKIFKEYYNVKVIGSTFDEF